LRKQFLNEFILKNIEASDPFLFLHSNWNTIIDVPPPRENLVWDNGQVRVGLKDFSGPHAARAASVDDLEGRKEDGNVEESVSVCSTPNMIKSILPMRELLIPRSPTRARKSKLPLAVAVPLQ
tara:strand:- start:1375 stop:1743 length:369 start_codon:yes stop_codon:yes gene_type:complete